MDIELAEGEKVLKEGPANHFKGAESVGGKLYLTNLRLVFISHALNVQVHEESYLRQEVVSVKPRNTLGLIPNGLSVFLKDGREEKFVVNGRKDWMNKLGSEAG